MSTYLSLTTLRNECVIVSISSILAVQQLKRLGRVFTRLWFENYYIDVADPFDAVRDLVLVKSPPDA